MCHNGYSQYYIINMKTSNKKKSPHYYQIYLLMIVSGMIHNYFLYNLKDNI